MYEAIADPYCYPGTTVLKNIPGLRSQEDLERFEIAATGRRFLEPLPAGRLSLRHYQAIHCHIFQDVYAWAGRFRTVRIAKGDSMFCYPEHIPAEMRRVFGWLGDQGFLRGRDSAAFAGSAAHFLAELNAIHPFRDGNGRTQLAFMAEGAVRAGHPLDLGRLDPEAYLQAMVASFQGNERLLAAQLGSLIQP
jgi:cell filamentation protein, protein adenylyltransferase